MKIGWKECIKNALKFLKNTVEHLIENHVPSIVATLFCFLACVMIPQLAHIFDLPSLWNVEGRRDIFITCSFWLFMAITVVWYIFLLSFTVPNTITTDGNSSRFIRFIVWFENMLRKAYEFKNRKIVKIVALLLGILFLALGYTAWCKLPEYFWANILSWSILISLLCLWVLLTPNFSNKPDRPVIRETLTRITFFIIISSIIGEALWFSIGRIPFTSYRIYSIAAVIHSCAVIIMFAQFFEILGHKGKAIMLSLPLVFWLLSFFIDVWQSPIVGRSKVGQPDQQQVFQQKQEKISKEWLENFGKRIDEIPAEKPVIIVCAAGGGSRAALFAALLFEYLKRLSINDAELKVIELDDTKSDKTKLADCVVLISGVSGGSLASGYFAYPPPDRPKGIRNSITSELKTLVFSEYDLNQPYKLIEKLRDAEKNSDNVSLYLKSQLSEKLQKQINTYKGDNDKDSKFLNAFVDEFENLLDKNWIFSSPFVDDMNTNFMAPLLRGTFFLQGLERGESVSSFWEREFLHKEEENKNDLSFFSRFFCKEKKPWSIDTAWSRERPLLVFNSTDAKKGIRFAIGCPPLLRDGNRKENERTNELAMISLSDCDSNYGLSLSQAIRLSANFPWGFDIPKLHPKNEESGKIEEVFLIDGGVSDNTGLDTILQILLRMESHQEKANDVWKKLQQRGLVIIEIDSGAKPENPEGDWQETEQNSAKISQISGPWNAMNIASYKNSILTQLYRYEKIKDILNKKRVKSRSIPFTNPGQVMTAWALGPQDKADTILDFMKETKRFNEGFNEIIQELKGFAVWNFKDPDKLIRKLRDAAQNNDLVSAFLKKQLSESFQKRIGIYRNGQSQEFLADLVKEFNTILPKPLYNKESFANVKLSGETKRLSVEKDLTRKDLATLNRILLEYVYREEILKDDEIQYVDIQNMQQIYLQNIQEIYAENIQRAYSQQSQQSNIQKMLIHPRVDPNRINQARKK